jgi:hypothetical protein
VANKVGFLASKLGERLARLKATVQSKTAVRRTAACFLVLYFLFSVFCFPKFCFPKFCCFGVG